MRTADKQYTVIANTFSKWGFEFCADAIIKTADGRRTLKLGRDEILLHGGEVSLSAQKGAEELRVRHRLDSAERTLVHVDGVWHEAIGASSSPLIKIGRRATPAIPSTNNGMVAVEFFASPPFFRVSLNDDASIGIYGRIHTPDAPIDEEFEGTRVWRPGGKDEPVRIVQSGKLTVCFYHQADYPRWSTPAVVVPQPEPPAPPTKLQHCAAFVMVVAFLWAVGAFFTGALFNNPPTFWSYASYVALAYVILYMIIHEYYEVSYQWIEARHLTEMPPPFDAKKEDGKS